MKSTNQSLALRDSEDGAAERAEEIISPSPAPATAARSIARTPAPSGAGARSRPHPGHAHSEEAQQYEIMKHADEEFDKAVNIYNLTLAKALKTADGHPLELGREYYIVWEHAYTYGISREYLYARHVKVEWDSSREPVILFNRVQDSERKFVEFQLSNIYAKERNAKVELLAIQRKRLEWLQGDIAKLEKELGIESTAAPAAQLGDGAEGDS